MSKNRNNQFSLDILIALKGNKCVNCGIEKNIIFHHIVPLALGGKDILSNIVPLCDNCHFLLHHGVNKKGDINHSFLIKEGLNKTRKNGTILGRPSLTKQTILEKYPNYLEIYTQVKNKKISKKTAANILHISRPTYDKYEKCFESQ